MEKIYITDMTLSTCSHELSFKEKLEIAKYLDKMNVDILELPALENLKTDALYARTVATTVTNCGVSLPIGYTNETLNSAWANIQKAKHPRLRLDVPLSTVQMEYICHKKPAAVLTMIEEQIKNAKALCDDVDFTALDATRAEPAFLKNAIRLAIANGATVITVCDTAGIMLPDEFARFIEAVKAVVPELSGVRLASLCKNDLSLSAACAMSSVRAGCTELKAAVGTDTYTDILSIAQIIASRGVDLGYTCGINTMQMNRLSKQIERIIYTPEQGSAEISALPASNGEEFLLTEHDGMEEVNKAAAHLGYDLSEDDLNKVYASFKAIADKKDVSIRELDAIIASVALQVPPTYKLVSFVINSGNLMSATSNIVLDKNGKSLRGLSVGDGPIDASFLAIEQIIGTHYELDDFQIQAVTEGREAVGSALVKLRHSGKLYSGSGISTDIIAASIHAYINALNKIVYEEN